MFKSPTPTIPPLTKFKINFIPDLLSYDHFRMITVWIILYDRTAWSYDTVPWHRTLYYYDSIPSLLYYIGHLPVFIGFRFWYLSEYSYDEFSNILFWLSSRLVSNVNFLYFQPDSKNNLNNLNLWWNLFWWNKMEWVEKPSINYRL